MTLWLLIVSDVLAGEENAQRWLVALIGQLVVSRPALWSVQPTNNSHRPDLDTGKHTVTLLLRYKILHQTFRFHQILFFTLIRVAFTGSHTLSSLHPGHWTEVSYCDNLFWKIFCCLLWNISPWLSAVNVFYNLHTERTSCLTHHSTLTTSLNLHRQ